MGLFGKKVFLVQIEASIVWESYRDPRTGTYTAVCRMLNLNAVGDTAAELQACANEAMQLLFEDLFETGELEKFLRENGWRPRGELPSPDKSVRFDIPADWRQRQRFEELIPVTA